MFDKLTLGEWDQLCSRMERAMARVITHPEVLWRYGVLDDCREIHGDLMLTWHGMAALERELAEVGRHD